MKKIILTIIAMSMAFMLCSCGEREWIAKIDDESNEWVYVSNYSCDDIVFGPQEELIRSQIEKC